MGTEKTINIMENCLVSKYSYFYFKLNYMFLVYFDEHLECAASKPWSKYTTYVLLPNDVRQYNVF